MVRFKYYMFLLVYVLSRVYVCAMRTLGVMSARGLRASSVGRAVDVTPPWRLKPPPGPGSLARHFNLSLDMASPLPHVSMKAALLVSSKLS